MEGPKADPGDLAMVGSVLTLGAEFLVMWFSGKICFFCGTLGFRRSLNALKIIFLLKIC